MKCKKRPYNSKGHAFSGAISASRKTGKPMRAYKCLHCPKWHLTSQKQWSRSLDNAE